MKCCRRCNKILPEIVPLHDFDLCHKCHELIKDDPRITQARLLMNAAIDLAIREGSHVALH